MRAVPAPQPEVRLPPQYGVMEEVAKNAIRQVQRPTETVRIEEVVSARKRQRYAIRANGERALIAASARGAPADAAEVLLSAKGSDRLRWLRPMAIATNDFYARRESVRASWEGQFAFIEDSETAPGLRPPQIGALHATLAHWTITGDAATVVLPTGTGKTETMLALLVSQRPECVLVVVPTSALREQTANKFLTLGLLKRFGVAGAGARYPIVGIVDHRFAHVEDVVDFFGRCNVVVTTMSVIAGCSEPVQQKIAEVTSHLFIDEAHHISAPTWERFRTFFLHKPILQFTATPFRNDGKLVDGQVIFNYPLRKSQEEGYFRPINFSPVQDFNPFTADQTIARAAIAQLDRDRKDGLDHIVMARASTIERANEIFSIYATLGKKHQPRIVHSDMSPTDRRDALADLRERRSRIVVCVDMFGEGFDLPQLKIAALHDTHKSLAITLQFTGRFTRTLSDVGDATVITNLAAPGVEEALEALYAQDADWNVLLRRLSEGAMKKQIERADFMRGFTVPDKIPIRNLRPKMSTVVYRTRCRKWEPMAYERVIPERRRYTKLPTIHEQLNVMAFVTQEHEWVQWGSVRDVRNSTYDLYVLHWDRKRNLLFINSSNNSTLFRELAQAVAGRDVQLIRGETVFRCTYGIKQKVLMNLGLRHSLSRNVSFTMYAGANIEEGLSLAQLQGRVKTNLFERGFELGERVTIGCSQKGRIWEHWVAQDVKAWVDWCHHIGEKLLDESISPAKVLAGVQIPKRIDERPKLMPITIEWSEEALLRSEHKVAVALGGEVTPFFDVGIDLVEPDEEGPLRFEVHSRTRKAKYEIIFTSEGVEYVRTGGVAAQILIGRYPPRHLTDWFQEEPPIVRFADGSWLAYNGLVMQPLGIGLYDPDLINDDWSWKGVNLSVESQKPEKRKNSIQYRVIQTLRRSKAYDIVFNDDDSNEAADVVAIKVAGDDLIVHLYHCKFSLEPPGARVEDLYVVCGQAQRSAYRKESPKKLFDHLRSRDAQWIARYKVSRFEQGTPAMLDAIGRRLPYLTKQFKVFIVQPGLSKDAVKKRTEILKLLGVTELYLRETYGIDFEVIGNK